MSYIKPFTSRHFAVLSASFLAVSTTVFTQAALAVTERNYFNNTYTNDSQNHPSKANVKRAHHPVSKAQPSQANVNASYTPAAKEHPSRNNFGSFYVGIGLDRAGLNIKTVDTNTTNFLPEFGLTPNISESSSNGSGASVVYGSLYVGYETKYWNRFNIGVEAFLSLTPKTSSSVSTENFDSTVNGDATFELIQAWENLQFTDFFGIVLKPGFQIQPDVTINASVGYGVGGVSWQQFSSDVFGTGSTGNSTTGGTALLDTYDKNTHDNLNALILGVGFNVRNSENLTTGFGYKWLGYESIERSFILTDPTTGDSDYFSKRTPRMEVATASLNYYFTPTEEYCEGPAVRAGSEIYGALFADRDNSFGSNFSHEANPHAGDPLNHNEFFSPSSTVNRGWGGEALIGYGCTLSGGAYVGIEGFYDYSRSKFTEHGFGVVTTGVNAASAGATSHSSLTSKYKDGYGIAAVTGYKMNNNTMLYSKIGFAGRKVNVTANYTTTIEDPRTVALENYSINEDIFGYQIGAGLDVRLCDGLFMRSEYVLTYFGEWEQDRRSPPFLSASGAGFLVATDVAVSSLTGQFKLGLEYKFEI
jgi:opacity protein-like surface antigen